MKLKKLMVWVAILALAFSCTSYDGRCIDFLPHVEYWSFHNQSYYVRSFRITKPDLTLFGISSIDGKIELKFMKRGYPLPLDLPPEEILPP